MTGLLAGAAGAAPGDLDPAFGTAGTVITDFGGLTDEGHAVALQIDGKIVVGGFTSGPRCDFALARYLPEGTLDSTFGTAGKSITAFPDRFTFVNSILIQSDGKIVAVGGTFNDEFALARYKPDGTLDTSFGTDGLVVTTVGFGGYAFSAALQIDGKIVVVGQLFPRLTPQGYDVDFILARYQSDGTLDVGFGTNGIVLTDFQDSNEVAHAVAVQSDGKIVVGGYSSTRSAGGTYADFALARYNPDGSLDPSFGTSGKVTSDFGNAGDPRVDVANAIAIQADGSIVAAGVAGPQGASSSGGAFVLARYASDGTLDAGFGSGGRVLTDFGTGFAADEATSVVVLPSGKIVLGGLTGIPAFPTTVQDFAIARYNSNGTIDSVFGSSGTVVTDFGGVDTVRGLAVQPDGKVVAVGINSLASTGGDTKFALARYLGDPTDTTPPEITPAQEYPAHEYLIPATDPWGAIVTLPVTAWDELDGSVPVVCAPEMGSVFPIDPPGQFTQVDCFATDTAGNQAYAFYFVHVQDAGEQVADLIALVDSLPLNGKLGTSLHDKLVTVQRFLAADKPRQAEDNLASFINQVDAQRGKGLTGAQADALKTVALRIMNVIVT